MTISIRQGRSVRFATAISVRRLLAAAAAVIVLAAAVVNVFEDRRVERRHFAQPVSLTIHTVQPVSRTEVLRHIEPEFVTRRGESSVYAEHERLTNDRWTWRFTRLARRIELKLSPEFQHRIAGVSLAIAGREVPAALEPIGRGGKGARAYLRYRVAVPDGHVRRSLFDSGGGYLNWPGDGAVIGRIVRFLAVWGGLLGLIFIASRSQAFLRLCGRLLPDDPAQAQAAPAARASSGSLWLWAGLGVVAATLAALEWRDPFYFTQDDNFSQFLPVILAGGQSLLAGALFDYNPLQLLGAPTVEVGTYALTYPGTWLAFLLARALGDDALTLEIFCAGHLLLGFAATWWAARRWGAGPAAAAVPGVCFVLSGYALAAGRSWYYMTPAFFWLPLALGALHGVLYGARKRRDALLLGGSLGLLFHAGNAQMWIYAVGFTGLLALMFWLSGDRSRRAAVHFLAALCGALALAAPLLMMQLGFAGQAIRAGGDGYAVTQSFLSLFFPLPLTATDMNFRQNTETLLDIGPLLYAGPLLIPAGLLLAAAAAACWFGRSGRLAASAPALFAIAGGGALLLTFGFDGPLWFIHAGLPAFEKFNHPVKFVPFAVLLLGMAAVLGWARLNVPARTKSRATILFAVVASGLMFWNAQRTADLAFYYFADDPYPGLRRDLAAPRQHEARLFPIAPERSVWPDYPASRHLNFAMVQGEMSFWGYDPIITGHPFFEDTLIRLARNPLFLLREFGVDRIVVWQRARTHRPGVEFSDRLRSWQADIAARLMGSGIALPELGGVDALQQEIPVPGAKPLAFAAADASRSWPVTVAGPRVSVTLGEGEWPGGEMVLNFLAWPRLAVIADGKTVSVRADELGRVVATVPTGARKVELDYRIDWLPGLAAAVALLALAAYGVWRFDGPGRRRRETA